MKFSAITHANNIVLNATKYGTSLLAASHSIGIWHQLASVSLMKPSVCVWHPFQRSRHSVWATDWVITGIWFDSLQARPAGNTWAPQED